MDALEPFKVKAPIQEPEVLPYLKRANENTAIDIQLEVWLKPKDIDEIKICTSNFKYMYWTFAQMLTHHMSNGCNLQPGDLLASGTCSGPTDDSRACLAELSVRGTADITLPNGEVRRYLADGDEVIFRARAARAGRVPIGFGECRGRIEPAVPWPDG